MNKKQQVITKLFESCKENNNFIFHNDAVKTISKEVGFGNPFDVTKLDSSEKFPDILTDKNYFIIHLGEGNHMFVKGIDHAFHSFEHIKKKEEFDWEYKKSLLNEFDTSESNILSVGFNQRIVHKFLYSDIIANPKIYNARRTKSSLEFYINKQKIITKNLQMEIDLTAEYNGEVTVFEGKNNFPSNFALYQIYFPYLYYYNLKKNNKLDIKDINCCYLLRKIEDNKSILKIYQYSFTDPNDMASIKLLKKRQYNLINV
jgi:hypothetical protein